MAKQPSFKTPKSTAAKAPPKARPGGSANPRDVGKNYATNLFTPRGDAGGQTRSLPKFEASNSPLARLKEAGEKTRLDRSLGLYPGNKKSRGK